MAHHVSCEIQMENVRPPLSFTSHYGAGCAGYLARKQTSLPASRLLLRILGPRVPSGKFKGKRGFQQNVDGAPGTCPSVSAHQDSRGNLGRWCAFHRFLRRVACRAVSSGLGPTLKVRPVPRRSWLGHAPSRRKTGKVDGPLTDLQLPTSIGDKRLPFRSNTL